MPSILVVCYDTTTGRYLVQKAGSAQIADESITSAKIASGQVGGVHIYHGAVISAKIASGQVGIDHIYHGAVISAKLASGRIGGVHIVDATITSAKLASGQIGGALIQNLGILSGKYAAESITEQALVSGISIDISELSQEPSFRAGELISAYQGIQFSTSGYYGLAKIDDIDTMPALGIAIANLVSGSLGTFQYLGRITNAKWDFSGYVGDLLFLGSGQDTCEVTRIVPTASGECVQRIGKIAGEDNIFLKPELTYVQLAE